MHFKSIRKRGLGARERRSFVSHVLLEALDHRVDVFAVDVAVHLGQEAVDVLEEGEGYAGRPALGVRGQDVAHDPHRTRDVLKREPTS